jgi:hypothetical protein
LVDRTAGVRTFTSQVVTVVSEQAMVAAEVAVAATAAAAEAAVPAGLNPEQLALVRSSIRRLAVRHTKALTAVSTVTTLVG